MSLRMLQVCTVCGAEAWLDPCEGGWDGYCPNCQASLFVSKEPRMDEPEEPREELPRQAPSYSIYDADGAPYATGLSREGFKIYSAKLAEQGRTLRLDKVLERLGRGGEDIEVWREDA